MVFINQRAIMDGMMANQTHASQGESTPIKVGQVLGELLGQADVVMVAIASLLWIYIMIMALIAERRRYLAEAKMEDDQDEKC